jgi:hypothetical protein
MGIFDRLGSVIRSYLNDEDVFGKPTPVQDQYDPDLRAAFEELNEFLAGEKRKPFREPFQEREPFRETGYSRTEYSRTEYSKTKQGGTKYSHTAYSHSEYAGGNSGKTGRNSGRSSPRTDRPIPEELRGDFAELGLPFGAGPKECKGAYKKLLKQHHPDRHAGNPENMQRATERSARINAAFDRIEKWRTEHT